MQLFSCKSIKFFFHSTVVCVQSKKRAASLKMSGPGSYWANKSLENVEDSSFKKFSQSQQITANAVFTIGLTGHTLTQLIMEFSVLWTQDWEYDIPSSIPHLITRGQHGESSGTEQLL